MARVVSEKELWIHLRNLAKKNYFYCLRYSLEYVEIFE